MSLSATEFNYVRRLVLDQAAIVLEEDKGYLVESRLSPLARREGLGSLSVLVEKLQREPFNGLHRKAVEAMTTNETSFFRDFHPYEALKKSVLPDLIAKRAKERELSIWCAASSSGQNPTVFPYYGASTSLFRQAGIFGFWQLTSPRKYFPGHARGGIANLR